MAANMKAVKLRIKSVQNTMQITKAMELVASSKLRKAKDRADRCLPYFTELRNTLSEIAAGNTDFSSIYTRDPIPDSDKFLYILVAGDRGLAGGYNSNLFKRFEMHRQGKDFCVIPVGKKALEYVKKNKYEIVTEEFAEVATLGVGDCFEIARTACDEFSHLRIDHVQVCYTRFISMLSQKAGLMRLLPLEDLKPKGTSNSPVTNLILYEPSSEEVFEAIVPEYLAGLIYGSVCESLASELAARRNAMESATNNAEEMIEKLNLHYNRARQASITQEITEIVAGAEN